MVQVTKQVILSLPGTDSVTINALVCEMPEHQSFLISSQGYTLTLPRVLAVALYRELGGILNA